MGEVYLVRDTKLGRRAALKVISIEHLGSPEAVRDFLNEARTTARFSHPNIVTIHAVGEHEGRPYVALEYLEGQNLRERMQERQPSLQESLRITLAVADALREAHQNGVLHLDLKPENIVIPRDGRVRVVDFGLAKTFHVPDSETPIDDTSPGVLAAGWGTPAYVAPEQWRYRECTGATDVWALGVILFELCSGRLPFPQDHVVAKGKAICSKLPAPRLDELVDVPPELAALVARCLEKDAAARTTAGEVCSALEDLLHARRSTTVEDNPYRGLLPFTQLHAALFFGRDAEVSAFVERLREQPILTVVGPPGAGKSSFVQAGVIPRLLEQDRWTVIRYRPGPRPFVTLAERIHRHRNVSGQRRASGPLPSGDLTPGSVSGSGSSSTVMARSALDEEEDIETLAERLSETPDRLALTLRGIAEADSAKVLLLVEQIEELFTSVDDTRLRRAVMRAICGAADDPMEPVRVILTVRDDFLGRLATGPEAREALAQVMVLQSLGKDALVDVLTRPLESVGYDFEDPQLVEEMTDAVAGQPGSLPLLQFTAAKLWDLRDTNRRMLLRSAYHELGGVEGALAQHADGSLDGMSAEERRMAREILLRLVTPERTRRVVLQSDVLDGLGDAGDQVFARLVAARLISVRTQRGTTRGPVVELVHESLLRKWNTLRRWLDEAREDLVFVSEVTQAAQLWDRRGRQPQELWLGEALRDAQRMVDRAETELPELARAFLAAGAERNRRHQRRRRITWALMMSALVAIAVASVLTALFVGEKEREALAQRDRAERQRGEAIRAAAKAAMERGEMLEARARLRSALELDDSPSARALWWELRADPRRWVKQLGSLTYAVDYARDGSRIVVGSQDGATYVFDPNTRETSILRGSDDQVYAVAVSPDARRIAVGAWSGRIFVWNTGEVTPSASFDTRAGAVRGLRWRPDGRSLVASTDTGRVVVWPIDSGQAEHETAVSRAGGLALSPTGDTVAIAAETGLWLWRIGETEPRATDVGESLWSVDWSTDGRTIATGGGKPDVIVWDPAKERVRMRLGGHKSSLRSVALSADSRLLAAAGYDKTIRVWDVATGSVLEVLEGHSDGVEGVAFGPHGNVVASVGRDRTVRLWQLGAREKTTTTSPGHTAAVYRVAFSPDGTLVASAGGDHTVRLWDVETGTPVRTLAGHTAGVDAVAFSPDGTALASSSVDLTVRTWDVESGAERQVFTGNTARISAIAYDRRGTRLVSGSRDGTLTLYDLETGATLARAHAHDGGTYGVAFSPMGNTLATGGADGTVMLWTTTPLRRARVLRGHTATVHGVSFDPEGRWVASGSADRTIRVWDLLGGATRTFGPHGGRVYWSEFDHSGRLVGAPASDGTVTVWDIERQTRTELVGHRAEVNSVAFSPRGDLVATGGDDGTVRVWSAGDADPAWRAPILLAAPPRLLSHRGWVDLRTGDTVDGPRTAWATQVETNARHASVGPNGALLCVRERSGAVMLWDLGEDRPLSSPAGVGFEEVVTGHDSCLARSDAAVTLLRRDGSATPLALPGAVTSVAAFGGSDGGYLVAADRVLRVDESGSIRGSWPTGPGVTAVGATDHHIVAGYRDGNLELRALGNDAPVVTSAFEQVDASAVERILAGPPGTVVAGYANGSLGLWNLEDGARLVSARLHGRVVHLRVEAGKLYAATDLGDFLVWNLEAFYREYCELLAEVWADTPVVWQQGRAVEVRPSTPRCPAQ
jgi:WD40 repeat protein/serine/threonine protein kinase